MAHEVIFDNASRFNEMSVFLDLVLSFYFSVNHDTKFLLRNVTRSKNYLKNIQLRLSTKVALSFWISLF